MNEVTGCVVARKYISVCWGGEDAAQHAATGSFAEDPAASLAYMERQKKFEPQNLKLTFEVQQFHAVYPSAKWEQMQNGIHLGHFIKLIH